MVKYSTEPENPAKAAKARGSGLRVHFKNCREVGAAIKGKTVEGAQKYLQAVLKHKAGIPFRRYAGGCGRHAQGKQVGATGSQVGWPEKATKYFLDLLTNVAANAEARGLKSDGLRITHVQVNRAPYMRRRTYRAHGRINPYMCSPSHIEIMVTEADAAVEKAKEAAPAKKLSRKKLAQRRLKSGGGI